MCEHVFVMAAPPYVELHAHSAFSFLDGASAPEEMAERGGASMGHAALALTDHDGLCGSLAFAHAARAGGRAAHHRRRAHPARRLPPDPAGGRRGRLRQPVPAHHPGPRGHAPAAGPPRAAARPSTAPRLAAHAEGLVCLTGCARHGLVPRLVAAGARREALGGRCAALVRDFGPGNVHVEIQRPRSRGDRRLARDLARPGRGGRRALRGHRRPPRPHPRARPCCRTPSWPSATA